MGTDMSDNRLDTIKTLASLLKVTIKVLNGVAYRYDDIEAVWDPYTNWNDLMPHLMYHEIDITHTSLFVVCRHRDAVICRYSLGEFNTGELLPRDLVAKRAGVVALIRHLSKDAPDTKSTDDHTNTIPIDYGTDDKCEFIGLNEREWLFDEFENKWYVPIELRDIRPGQRIHFRSDDDQCTVLDCSIQTSTEVGIEFYVYNGCWSGIITDIETGAGYIKDWLRYKGQTDEEWAATIRRQFPTKARLIRPSIPKYGKDRWDTDDDIPF